MPSEEAKKNLIPFVPGKSGNPVGRKKGSVSLSRRLKRYLSEHPEELDAIVKKVVDDAKDGDVQARKLIFDRVDGGVPQRVNVSQLTDEQIMEMLTAELAVEDEDGDE